MIVSGRVDPRSLIQVLAGLLSGVLLCSLLWQPLPVLAADQCSSPALPLVITRSLSILNSLPKGAVVPGSVVDVPVSITCPSDALAVTNGCTNGGGWGLTALNPTPVSGMANTYSYPSLNPGLGYQILSDDGIPQVLNTDSDGASFFHMNNTPPVAGTQIAKVRMRFVKTADTVDATNEILDTPQMKMKCNSGAYANGPGLDSNVYLDYSIKLITSTCSLSSPDVQVALPDVVNTQFQGVGSAVGKTIFFLQFSCEANAKATFNISDATTPGNDGAILSLQSGSTATGVGIRMLSNTGSPVMLAPYQAFGSGSEFTIGGPDASVVGIPFTAEYVQTATEVTPGSVSAYALISINYE
jgi:type 1 fimbria pilin